MINTTTEIVITVVGDHAKGDTYSGYGGPAANASLHNPHDVALDTYGNIFITNDHDHLIRMVNSSTKSIVTYAGNKATGDSYSGNGGPALNASLNYPSRITFNSSGKLYIADVKDYVVRRVDPVSKIISIFADW
jgi:hypothetical protein